MSAGPIKIGVDFGGTKIEVAVLDNAGAVVHRARAPNPGAYGAAIDAVCGLVRDAETALGAKGTVGVGAPGSVSPRTGLMRNANSIWLNGKSFREDLAAALGREVRLANDANCLALSEAVDGAGAGGRVVFAVIVGTGCGGGLVVDGKLIEGATGVAGEFGHMPLPWLKEDEFPGPQCWCGKRNCLETWVSGSGLQRDFAARYGRVMQAEAIVNAARAGEADAKAALDAYIDRLARGLAAVCNIVDPDIFVLGGGMSNVGELYAALPDRIRAYIFSDIWDGDLRPAKWGDSSGVRGAARLW
ncbi:MAG TPA: ROK family protein [Caulobacterales bacterium]|nr:ROK family protein [Caulobacterales bacterium]